jgi:hypothetical protein
MRYLGASRLSCNVQPLLLIGSEDSSIELGSCIDIVPNWRSEKQNGIVKDRGGCFRGFKKPWETLSEFAAMIVIGESL